MSQQVSHSTTNVTPVTKAARLFIILDQDLNIQAFNDFTAAKVVKHTGLTLSEHQSITAYVPAGNKKFVIKFLRKVLSGITICEAPYFLGTENEHSGKTVLYSPVFDPEANITGISVYSNPSQARLKTPPEINSFKDKPAGDPVQSHDQYHYTILESITDGFVTVDRNHIVTYWNKEAEKMLGLPRKKVLGNNLLELFMAMGESRFYEVLNTAMNENKTFHFEDFFQRKKIWLEGSIYPSSDGLTVFFRDVSKRKEFEENLRRERNLLRILIDNIPDYIYVKDTHLDNVISNRTKINQPVKEETHINKTAFDYFDESLEERFRQDERQVLDSGLPIINKEEIITTADGQQRWLLTTKMPLKDDRERVMGIVGISRDITDAKRSEILLKELNASLEQRAAELVASNLELERFAYVASHDLQEPLRMVSSFLQLLKKKYQGQLDEKAEQYIYFAVDGAERMKKLIMDLLEYSRTGSSKEGYSLTDINMVVRDVVALFDDIVEKTGAMITFDGLPVIKTNKTQIIQLFQNLVSNALKYKSESVPEITIHAEEQSDHWLFSVKDNGMGIDTRYFEKIFIIFQRLHSKNDYSGTGIGLAICKKIVEKHGGMIWVESMPGKGSTFYFTISKYL